MTDLVFLDVETTGLDLDRDRIWEFAAIRRTPDGTETELHMQVRHDLKLAAALPDKFRRDHADRYDRPGAEFAWHAPHKIARFMEGRPQIVGVNPTFDTSILARMMARQGVTPPWDHRLLDLPAITIGRLWAVGELVEFPARSDDLAARAGIDTERYARHTAMGDVEWCRDWWDTLNRPVIL